MVSLQAQCPSLYSLVSRIAILSRLINIGVCHMPNVVDSLGLLKTKLLEIQHLRNAAALLSWDQETYMPVGLSLIHI